MSLGRVLIIPGLVFNNPNAPKLISVDPLESKGSLLLIEPISSTTPWNPGVPANGSSVPNLMQKFAANLGIANSETGGVIVSSGMTGTTGLLERSAKGGLHGIVSKTNTPAAGVGLKIEFTDALKAYLLANPTHKYFASVWRKITRVGSIEQFSGIHNSSGGTNNNLFIMGADLSRPIQAGATHLGTRSVNRNTVGDSIVNTGANGWVGGPPATTALLQARAISWGSPNGVGGASSNCTSDVFYRFYLEDLTVSGRTYAEVDALDFTQFEKHVLNKGGRYYADTFTDPATLP